MKLSAKLLEIYNNALQIVGEASKSELVLNATGDDIVLTIDTEYTDNDEVWPIGIKGEILTCVGVDSGETEQVSILEIDLWALTELADHITTYLRGQQSTLLAL